MNAFLLHLAGVVIGDLCETPSHYQSINKFSEKLKQAGVPGIAGVDTRLLVKTIRSRGTVKGYLSKTKQETFSETEYNTTLGRKGLNK